MHNNRKELCRNFQRGSCQYGERCKFLHVTQQRSSGFGYQPQQKPNSFGFGPQNNSHSNTQSKPFENKWTRFSPIPSQQQSDSKPKSEDHKCLDADSCKRLIVEDLKNERPLWKLTCYAHWKSAPCDIVGDVSYEELRAAAYHDAKRGLSVHAIVERERNLLSSKIREFENLLHNPYKGPVGTAVAKQSPFPVASSSAFSQAPQTSVPPSVSSFSQLGASLNVGPRIRPSAPLTNAFMQPNSLQNINSQTSGAFGSNNLPFGGSFGNHLQNQRFGSSFTSNSTGFNNNSIINAQSNPFSTLTVSTLNSNSSGSQVAILSSAPNSNSTASGLITAKNQPVSELQSESASSRDMSVWLKEKWMPGEIPEEAPPHGVV